MAASTPSVAVGSPPLARIEDELIQVAHPYFPGKVTWISLPSREVHVLDETKELTSTGKVPYKTLRMALSPIVMSDNPNAICEVVELTIIDPRFLPTKVLLFSTLQQAHALRQTAVPANIARPVVPSGDKHLRLRCYTRDCSYHSSQMGKMEAHFRSAHTGVEYNPHHIKLYEVGGPNDPNVVRSSSARYNTPSTSGRSATSPMDGQNNASTTGNLKRRRGCGDTHLDIANKAQRTTHFSDYTGEVPLPSAKSAGNLGNKRDGVDRATSPEIAAIHEHLAKYPIPKDAVMCVCLGPNDGRNIIQCDNKDACYMRYFHVECVNMTSEEYVNGEYWYCDRCIDEDIGGAGQYKVAMPAPRPILKPTPIKIRMNTGKGKGKAASNSSTTSRHVEVPEPSPSTNMNLWSADQLKAFVENPDNLRDFDVESLERSRAALIRLSQIPVGRPNAPAAGQDEWGRPLNTAGTIKTPNSRSWTAEEEQHLKEVVKECVNEGLSGEPLWRAAHPRLVARGVTRAMGGLKMRWCRGLREETKIDERRKKNNRKMITALQGPKTNKDKPSFKGKDLHLSNASATASSPIRYSTGMVSPATRTAPIRDAPYFDSMNFDDETEMRNEREDSVDSVGSEDSILQDAARGIRRRARSV